MGGSLAWTPPSSAHSPSSIGLGQPSGLGPSQCPVETALHRQEQAEPSAAISTELLSSLTHTSQADCHQTQGQMGRKGSRSPVHVPISLAKFLYLVVPMGGVGAASVQSKYTILVVRVSLPQALGRPRLKAPGRRCAGRVMNIKKQLYPGRTRYESSQQPCPSPSHFHGA